MAPIVETITPEEVMVPIGPYSHIAKVGTAITIGAIAGVDPATGELSGPDVESQTARILESFQIMLASVGSDFEHIIHINVFLRNMADFAEMNAVYAEKMGNCRPARTAISVAGLPKPGALVTINLTAVTAD